MPRKIVPFSLELKRLTISQTRRRTGMTRQGLERLFESGDLVLVAMPPGVRARVLESSVDAFLERANATATIAG